MRRVVVYRASHVAPDPRVDRAAAVIAAQGYHVEVLAWDRDGGLDKVTQTPYSQITRYKRVAKHGRGLVANLVGFALFQLFLVRHTLWLCKRLSAIHACDLSTGLTGLVLSRLLSVPLVYDVFDYYADSFAVPRPLLPLARRLEALVLAAADEVILPAETRLEQIGPVRPKRLTIVENSPDMSHLRPHPRPVTDLGYVGILAPGRLIEEVAHRVAEHPEVTLRIAGFGPLEEKVSQLAAAAPNIEYLGTVDATEAISVLDSCRVMFATYDPAVPNHRFSAPNKYAEALALGKPLVVCRDTSIDRLVAQSGFGRVINYNADEFMAVIAEVLSDEDFLERCRTGGPRLYASSHSWDVNAARLGSVYARVAAAKPWHTA